MPRGATPSEREGRGGGPSLRKIGRGWLFIRDDGAGYLLERAWLDGARIAYVGARLKAWICWRVIMLLGTGDPGGWRWALLPSAGDWAYSDDDGRLASLAHFINAELRRRERRR